MSIRWVMRGNLLMAAAAAMNSGVRAELAAASAEMEESARLLERFQGLDLAEDKKISSSVKRKLKQLETIKANLSENERLLTERDEQVIKQ